MTKTFLTNNTFKQYDCYSQGLLYPESLKPFTDSQLFPKFEYDKKCFSVINAWWLASFSHLSYHNAADIKTQLNELGFHSIKLIQVENTFCYICENKHIRIIAFRGTQFANKVDAKTDLNFPLEKFNNEASVHRGFFKAANLIHQEILNAFAEFDSNLNSSLDSNIETKQKPLWICGHSLGAALAIIVAAQLKQPTHCQTYTFGAPKIGNSAFNLLCKHLSIYRIVNCCDIVTHLPPAGMGFKHVGDELFLSAHNHLHHNPTKLNRLLIEWQAAIRYACNFPLFRKKQISFRALSDHSIVNYCISLWNLNFKENG